MKLFERSEQQIFDDALSHARKQGRRSVDNNGKCVYRSPEGLKCFIGALISDEDYDPKFEVQLLCELPPEKIGIPTQNKRPLTMLLQNAHDLFDPEFWEREFEKIAEKFDLKYTPPQ